MTPSLAHHLQHLPEGMVLATWGDLQTPISAPFVEDNRATQRGGVFVARKGKSADGHAYIADAIARGASAIVGELAMPDCAVPYVQVRDAQQATGYLAASYHGFPSRALVVIGVTGTDGKTTTSTLIYELLKDLTAGKVGIISTISADFGGKSLPTGLHVTTPSAPEVQDYLAQMRDAGLTHVVLEMTSHGLHQGRLNGVDVDVAVVTNITHEHLDYHGTWENYRDAKALLFRKLSESARKPNTPKLSVVNRDDATHAYLTAIPADKVISYGRDASASYRADNVRFAPDGTRFTLFSPQGTSDLHLPLFGGFNVSNALAAVAVARELGWHDVQAGLSRVRAISGRMEAIDEGQAFIAMVDFAHTPNALDNALQTGRTLIPPSGRVIAVFGSAGLRDVEKRRMMAEVSAQRADITILTAEDPRTESLDDILAMMAEGCRRYGGVEGQTFFRVRDRGQALAFACQMARAGDIVMACGKGHEQSMCFGTTEYDWDDRDALRAALRGTPLKTLPTAEA